MFYCGVQSFNKTRIYTHTHKTETELQNRQRARRERMKKRWKVHHHTCVHQLNVFILWCEIVTKKNSIPNCAFNRNINNAFSDKSIPLREDSKRCFFCFLCVCVSVTITKVEKTSRKPDFGALKLKTLTQSIVLLHSTLLQRHHANTQTQIHSKEIQK